MAKRVESPSSINTFKQCPRKYYYQYIEKLPTIPNVHQIRGNIVHSTLENFYNIDLSAFSNENYSQKLREAVQQLFLHYWNQYYDKLNLLNLSKDQQIFYFEETMLMLLNWANHFIEEVNKMITEKNLSFQEVFHKLTPLREQGLKSEKRSVQGFIDAIRHVEEEIQIIDYKTNAGFDLKDEIKLQLAIYCLLYYETYDKMPTKVGVFFLRHKIKWMNVNQDLLELAKQEIAVIHNHTSKSEDICHYPQNVSPLCKWHSGQCDFYQICRPNQQ